MFACLFVAEAAEAYGVLAWFRHEPGGVGDMFLFLAPGAFHRVFR